MKRHTYLHSKYLFKGLDYLALGEDNKFYRLPFESNKRYYDIIELKVKEHKGVNKLSYMGKRYTNDQLKELKYKEKIVIKEEINKFYLPIN